MRVLSYILTIILVAILAFGAGTVLGPTLIPQLNQWVQIGLPQVITPEEGDAGQQGYTSLTPDKQTTNIRVTGSSEIKVKPDMATLSVGVTETAAEPQAAQQAVSEKINAINQALQTAGVEEKDITTQAVSLYPQYNKLIGVTTITNYRASTTLSIRTTDLDNVGNLIDVATEAGATDLHNVEFSLQDETQARNEALRAAVQSAKGNADTIAESAGLTIARIDYLDQESGGNVYVRNYVMSFKDASDMESSTASADTQITSDDLVISATIDANYIAE